MKSAYPYQDLALYVLTASSVIDTVISILERLK
jgi:hypothetical protein